MIVYFSGTGNSKYIAEVMARGLDDGIIDATELVKQEKQVEITSNTPYVFVAPTYAWRMPRIFEEWIEKNKFDGNKKAYFVLTCGGEIGAAGNYIKKFSRRLGFEYMGTAQVIMPENYLIMFEPTAKEDDERIVNAAVEHAAALCRQIEENTPFDKVKILFVGYLESGIVNSSFYTFYIDSKKFYATDSCISCGKCVQSCMLNNITLKDGKPIWGKECTHCLACICKCPTEAIEYGKNTKGRRRYFFDSANK